jgi:DNA uptake protein ComE-like DNA-binding protein
MQPALERQLAKAEGAARAERAKREERERAREGKGASKPRRRASSPKGRASGRDSATVGTPAAPAIVDVDVADTVLLATLPGVGPALARRIADDRRIRGAFGGMEALDAVPGVGPRLLAGLAGRVTFSGPRRPTNGMKQPARPGTRASSVPAVRRRRGPR